MSLQTDGVSLKAIGLEANKVHLVVGRLVHQISWQIVRNWDRVSLVTRGHEVNRDNI